MPESWIDHLVDDVLDKHGIGSPVCPDCDRVMTLKAEPLSPRVTQQKLFECQTCQRIAVR